MESTLAFFFSQDDSRRTGGLQGGAFKSPTDQYLPDGRSFGVLSWVRGEETPARANKLAVLDQFSLTV